MIVIYMRLNMRTQRARILYLIEFKYTRTLHNRLYTIAATYAIIGNFLDYCGQWNTLTINSLISTSR